MYTRQIGAFILTLEEDDVASCDSLDPRGSLSPEEELQTGAGGVSQQE